jgi:CO dehydrogenase/acetyl-CoA synthase alpha subunit
MNPNALEKYENCRQCRECESKCPYELAILDMMADKVKWLRKHYGSQISRSRKIRRLGHIKFRVRKKGSQGKHS